MNLQTNQKGFTIVELLIVIVVIAILAAISIVAFTGIQQRGRDAQRAADSANIVKALSALSAEEGFSWPTTVATSTTGVRAVLNSSSTANLGTSVTDKIQVAAPASSNQIQYQYRLCSTAASPATTPVTGAEIVYYREGGTAGAQTVKAGTGNNCFNAS